MSRFLFVVPPLAGHLNPSLGVGQALARAGHEVAWCGPELHVRPLLGPDALVFPTGSRLHRPQSDHGLAAVKSVWDRFIVPFARFSLPAVEKAAADYRPDVLVVDQHSPAGAIAAHRLGLTWATLACSTMDLGDPLAGLPRVREWVEGRVRHLWDKAGLPAEEYFDLRFSPHLVIASTGRALAGSDFPEHYALVGPVLAERPAQPDFPWDWLDPDREHVLVSMGTLADDVSSRFLHETVAALAPLGERLQGVFVAPPDALPDLPPHLLARARVPMLDLLPRMDLVVSHGGLNTVCESLANGVPLVVAPIRHDQPINANQVVAAGAGVRVGFARADADALRAAVTTVLGDPAHRAAAHRVRASFAEAGGADAAAAALTRLSAQSTAQSPVPAGRGGSTS
ncbi:nucleotide disphospho-sugar-binding domain-containing protein [Actinokineospora sp. NBRC 105648]|uniref:glycosyltransferase n=1 Tax=Actinokineospora sp. NBRC 105648 TaxID=3032206 RepID=UPI0024A606E1|nr:nucleotide disphospho-sugar-binding domain-containing protein [Actinokineospora sp. NBRC 105648]GLZ39778.1 glycosyl transferase [Actinokineospora sp. NBRC 105648]